MERNADKYVSSEAGGSIRSAERALNILKLFKEEDEAGISEISRKLNLPKGTVYGLVKTLVQSGFLEKNEETRRYRCGVEIFRLGMRVAVSMDIRRISAECARKLCEEVREAVHLSVLMDGMCVNVDQFNPVKQFLLIPQVGSAVPAHCTATGKCLLSQLSDEQLQTVIKRVGLPRYTPHTITEETELRRQLQEIRDREFAVADQEALLGLSCVGAPIKDYSGKVVAAISVAGSTETVMKKERFREIVRAVKRAAGDIADKLGYEERPCIE